MLTAPWKRNNIHVPVKVASQQSLGRYQIEAEIGRGAMGVVYRALDPKIDRVVAIKTISLSGHEPEAEQEYRERFLQEARAAGRLSHPGIVTIHDAAEDPETHEPYIVMEYIAGQSLGKIMSGQNRKMPLPMALQFAQEIAEALDYAHSQGVIHRDIKPANILITSEGHTKIADFGVARLNQELFTQPGQIVGSPAYMAPEQMTGGEADARSDLFSLGVILYGMITGFRPFQGNSAQTVCFKVINVEPMPVTSFEHDVPPELDGLISRAIAKDPTERYQSGAEMARDIQACRGVNEVSEDEATTFLARVAGGDSDPRESANPKLDSHNTRALIRQGLTLAAIFSLIVAVSVFAWHANHPPTPSQGKPAKVLLQPVAPEETIHAPEDTPAPEAATHAPQNTGAPGTATHAPGQRSPALPKPVKPKVGQIIAKKLEVKQEAPVTPSTPAVAEAPSAVIEVEIRHRFAAGQATIWVDDELIYEQKIRGSTQRRLLFRSAQMNQVTSFKLKPGRHQLQIRVVSPDNTYDQIQTLELDVTPASEHVLHVNCDKRKMQVALE